MAKDKLNLDIRDPALAEYFSRKGPGDTCRFEIQATIDEVANQLAVLSVVDVGVEPQPEDLPDSEDAPARVMLAEEEPDAYTGR